MKEWAVPLGTAALMAAIAACTPELHPADLASRVGAVFLPDPAERIECPKRARDSPLVVLALGQSNAGNHGAALPVLPAPRSVFFDGGCYFTRGPSPGATGRGSSIWSALGPLLEGRLGRRVLISTLAVESTSIADWSGSNALRDRLDVTLNQMAKAGLRPDLVLWQQGEADALAKTTEDNYRVRFSSLVAHLRKQGVSAPIVVALSTRCRNSYGEPIRRALQAEASVVPGVVVGPNTDVLDGAHRDRDCHFSGPGVIAAAELWAATIGRHFGRQFRADSINAGARPPTCRVSPGGQAGEVRAGNATGSERHGSQDSCCSCRSGRNDRSNRILSAPDSGVAGRS